MGPGRVSEAQQGPVVAMDQVRCKAHRVGPTPEARRLVGDCENFRKSWRLGSVGEKPSKPCSQRLRLETHTTWLRRKGFWSTAGRALDLCSRPAAEKLAQHSQSDLGLWCCLGFKIQPFPLPGNVTLGQLCDLSIPRLPLKEGLSRTYLIGLSCTYFKSDNLHDIERTLTPCSPSKW